MPQSRARVSGDRDSSHRGPRERCPACGQARPSLPAWAMSRGDLSFAAPTGTQTCVLVLSENAHNEVKIPSSRFPSSFILSYFHVQTIHLLTVSPLSRFWMKPLAHLVLIPSPKSCLILDTLKERVKSCKGNWENCGILLTPIADAVDVLWFLILLVLLLQ